MLDTFVGLPDGSAWIRDRFEGDAGDPSAVGRMAAERALAAGASDLLAQAESAPEAADRPAAHPGA